jgi:EAL domain-containing protein (putative c-di-GMP-specific phosphodiesterase class I)/FixJ family two-component response regulator
MNIRFINQSVLVVDDEPFILQTTEIMLKRLGFSHVYKAESGLQALAYLAAEDSQIDLVLCDLNMPDIDGVELLRHFDEKAYTGDVVIFSGEDNRTLNMAMSLAKARHLSVLGAVSKPLKIDELARLLEKRKEPQEKEKVSSTELVTPEALAMAIEAGELVPWYQPKVDVVSREVVAVEALARWISPSAGMIFPDRFIPVAEEHKLIDTLTFHLIKNAVVAEERWRKEGINLEVAINISMDSLYDLSFPEKVGKCLNLSIGKSTNFQLEVTESRLMEDLVGPLDVLLRLRLKKIKLSIDDFGTGHSSLAQLRDLPFDELKIDRSFVQGAENDDKARAILESSIEMAKKLGMTVVAEGIETYDEWLLVEKLACDQVQGYFISRPLSEDKLLGWLAQWPQQRKLLFP